MVKSIKRVHRIAVVVFPGFLTLDVFGPLEAFVMATHHVRDQPKPGYEAELYAYSSGVICTSSGIDVVVKRSLAEMDEVPDTLVIAGSELLDVVLAQRELIDWLREWGPRMPRVASICTGSFLLAEAGLLDGRRVTTHWGACPVFRQRYPNVCLETDPIFVRDGNIYTSAGITAGIDLALGLIEADLGADVALYVARRLVLYLRRAGGQAQYSPYMDIPWAADEAIAKVQRWAAQNLTEDLSVNTLAARAGMSPRHFARVFRLEVGATPAKYVEAVRVDAARLRLEATAMSVEEVAMACGFGTSESMRRAFIRTLGVPPAEYRSHFSTHHNQDKGSIYGAYM